MKNNIVDEWFKVEYIYTKSGSDSLVYNDDKEFDDRKSAEKFASIVYFLSQVKPTDYDDRIAMLSRQHIGKGRRVRRLSHMYRYIKLEIELKKKEK